MKIDYPSKSKFLFACEEGIRKNRDALIRGRPITIPLPMGGYQAKITVTIDRKDPHSFQTNWSSSDPSRFPVRIKAAAYALFKNGYYGVFSISHFAGIITIQPLKLSIQIDTLFNYDTPHTVTEFVRAKNKPSLQNQLIQTLEMIPWVTWQLIVRNEPEWQQLESLRPKFPHGSFSAFMLAAGLNAYQLKGRAELTYWPRLSEFMKNFDLEPSIEALFEYLAEFYKTERLYNSKIERLSRFLSSSLASKLLTMPIQEIASMTIDIWQSLGNVMNQALNEKTICFAMKCLGISLMMENEYDFDFHNIPIPVDSRIIKFTNSLGLNIGEKTQNIQSFWNGILSSLRQSFPHMNMIHLDSIVWQIAHHNSEELISYFDDLGITDVGILLSKFLHDSDSYLKEIQNPPIDNSNNSSQENLFSQKRILILFPCSGRKNDYVYRETFNKSKETRVVDSLQKTRSFLTSGRSGLSSCIHANSNPLPALDLYNGYLYNSDPNFRNSIRQALSNKNVHVLILSGAHGVATPSERIHNYDQMMNFTYWKSHGLPKIIEEYIIHNKITHVYGFFSKTTDYMKIMASVGWTKLKDLCSLQSAKVYYIELTSPGGALKIVPDTLGKLITRFIQFGFHEADFYENPFKGQIIKFESFVPSSRSSIDHRIYPSKNKAFSKDQPQLTNTKARSTKTAPSSTDFQTALDNIFEKAVQEAKTDIEITSKNLHRIVGGYPGPKHRMPVCCSVMKKIMLPGDKIIYMPPSGKGATLTIRYKLPRQR